MASMAWTDRFGDFSPLAASSCWLEWYPRLSSRPRASRLAWQAFAVLLPVRTVGVMGDYRTYEYVAGLRAVASSDGHDVGLLPLRDGLHRAGGDGGDDRRE